jgi:hypothetical protein
VAQICLPLAAVLLWLACFLDISSVSTQIKLKNLIIACFIPPDYQDRIMQHCHWCALLPSEKPVQAVLSVYSSLVIQL